MFHVDKRARHKNSKLYAHFYIVSKYGELKLAGLKEEMNLAMIVVGNFNTPLNK